MDEDFWLGLAAGVGIALTSLFMVIPVTQNIERTKWCKHLHESHKTVEACKVNPDWSKGDKQ